MFFKYIYGKERSFPLALDSNRRNKKEEKRGIYTSIYSSYIWEADQGRF